MKTKSILLAVCMCLAALNAKAQGYWVNDSTAPNYQENNYTEPAWEDKIVDRIDELLKSSIFKTSTVGIEVYDITANKLLYTYNESQTMRPASTQKVLTAVTALDRLGGYYEFKTRLYYDGEIADGVLNGDLYCIGGFDPAFNAEDLESFVSALAEAGIDTIRGGVYADLHFKDDGRLGEGWCWDDDNPTLTPYGCQERQLPAAFLFYAKTTRDSNPRVNRRDRHTTYSQAVAHCDTLHRPHSETYDEE